MSNKHTEIKAIQSLSKKHDIRIVGGVIFVLNGKSNKQPAVHDVGNKSWGKIDYLRKKCGYRQVFVYEF